MPDLTEYFSMQGRVYIGKRNADGSRAPARWVYDASVLETKQTVSREEKQESWSGARGVGATMLGKRNMDVNLTLGQLNTDLAALAMDGQRVDIAAGSALNEIIGDVKAGDVVALARAAVTTLTLVSGVSTAMVVDVDYTLNGPLGIITFLQDKTAVKASTYDYAAHSLVTFFNGTNDDHYILFAGLNTVDGAKLHARGELYNIALDPAETLGYIQSGFGDLQLKGKCKLDPYRQIDPKWGGYGRLMLVPVI